MTQAANLGALGTNVNSSGIAQAAGGGTAGTAGVTGFKNRLINGDMSIDQRLQGSALTVSPSNSLYYGLDRFQVWSFPTGAAGTWTWQRQTATPPAGFTYYGRATVTTPDSSVAGNDFYTIQQAIEGFSTADLDFGTTNAKPFTVSFWVRSSVTGTFSCCPYFANASQGYPLTYTINAANTWEYKTISFPALTNSSLSGTDKTNGAALYLIFSLGMGSTFTGAAGVLASSAYAATGSTNLISTNGATFDITGVQLEVGAAATNFDYLPYGTELMLCQRYCEALYNGTGSDTWYSSASGGGGKRYYWTFKVEKRAQASIALGTGSSWYQVSPNVYPSQSGCGFYNASTDYGPLGTNGTVALLATAEI